MQMKAVQALLLKVFEFIMKDFVLDVLMKTCRDVAMKFIEKTPWAVIVERLLTRVLVSCLKWLSRSSTNEVWVDTVNDFIAVLNGKGLRDAKPIKDEPGVNRKLEPDETSQ